MDTTLPNVTAASIIMPTLNEAGNIADLIRQSVCALRRAGVDQVQVIVVDDDSPDGTWAVAEQIDCVEAEVHVIRRLCNHGLTNALRDGIAAAEHDIIVWMDCDFSHPPERIPQMLYMLGQGFDVVVNSRYTVGGGEDRAGKGGPLQRLLSFVLNWGVRFLLYPAFADYTSGFVAVRREVLRAVPLQGDYGEYFVRFIFRALRQDYKVCELPYFAMPRRSGTSKTGTNLWDYARRGRKYLWTVVQLRLDVLRGAI
jgi:dolichol-phosphate mannosyltransferase